MRCRLQNHQKLRKLLGLAQYRREHAVKVLLENVLEEERRMQAYLGKKKSPVMTIEDLKKTQKAADCHICKESLIKDVVLDNFSVHHPDSGRYCGQSHRRCFCEILRKTGITGPQRERKGKDTIDHWIAKNKKKYACSAPSLLLVTKTRTLSEGPMPHHRTDGRTCCCWRMSPKTSAGKVCLDK